MHNFNCVCIKILIMILLKMGLSFPSGEPKVCLSPRNTFLPVERPPDALVCSHCLHLGLFICSWVKPACDY